MYDNSGWGRGDVWTMNEKNKNLDPTRINTIIEVMICMKC